MASSTSHPARHPSPILAAMAARCPQCAKGKLFSGFLEVAPRCSNCQVDLSTFDAGDGPVAFIVAIVGFIVLGLALAVELSYQPSYWVHAALWLPLATALPLAMMRPFKGFFIGLRCRHEPSSPSAPVEPNPGENGN
ncbi:MAG: DUF983 domain-containing protein [Alphaproteobacteria bacterium]